MLEIGNVMDQLTSQIGRVAKRESRAAAKKLAPPVDDAVPVPSGMSRQHRKRANRMRRLGLSAPVPQPTNGDEPQ